MPVFGFIFEVIIITSIIILFGEIIPKIYASVVSVNFLRFIVYPFNVIRYILIPFSFILSGLGKIFISNNEKQKISVTELSKAIDITINDIKKEEKKILKGIVNFGNISVKEIMKPRIDVVAADIHISFSEIIDIIKKSRYSRIPIYEDTFDNIKGILFIKDLLPYFDKNEYEWQKLIKPAYFVPETKMIDDLFEEFKKNKVHIAIVVDEYGGTSGIITMEDILEEIVGEINDESDVEEFIYVKLSNNTYIFEGKVLINDFCKIIQINDSQFDDVRGEAETLAGLILEIKGDMPSKNEVIKYKNFIFTIENVDERRIKRIKVVIN
jgi:gliding motility-associated protein GldE